MLFNSKMRSIILLLLIYWCTAAQAKIPIFGEPPSITKLYGSDLVLNKISKKLNQPESNQFVAITGIQGIGKSSIARLFIEKQQNNYDFALWINSQQDITEQIESFFSMFKLYFPNHIPQNFNFSCADTSCYKKFRWLLKHSSLRWIMVIDDAKEYADISEFIIELPSLEKANYIATSEYSSNWNNIVKITNMDEENAIEMLLALSEKANSLYSTKICKELNFHPFAIMIGAKFIRETPTLSLQDFYTLLKNRRSNMLSGPLKVVNDSFKITLEKIKNESQEAYFLLSLGSLIGSENFPEELLKICFQQFYDDEVAFYKAIHTLSSFGVLSFIENDSTKEKICYFHELILDTLKKEILLPEKISALKLVMTVIKKHFLKSDKQSLDESTDYILKPLINICQTSIESGMVNRELLSLCIDIIEHILITKRDYKWGDEFIESVKPQFLDCEHKDLQVKFFTYVGAENSNFRQANITLQNAIEIYESQKLNSKEKAPPPGYSYYIQANTYLGANYAFLGNLEESDKVYKKISEITQQYGYDTDKENKWSIFVNQVMHKKIKYDIFFAKGSYSLAQKQMLNIFNLIDSFTESHSTSIDIEKICIWFYGQKYLIHILAEQENLDVDLVIREIKGFLGRNLPEAKDNPLDFNFSILYEALALAELRKNNLQEALNHANTAIKILNSWFADSSSHNEHAFAELILAQIQYQDNEFNTASQHLKKALDIYEKNLDNVSVENVRKIYTIFTNIAKKTHNEIILEHFKNLYKKSFNSDSKYMLAIDSSDTVSIF